MPAAALTNSRAAASVAPVVDLEKRKSAIQRRVVNYDKDASSTTTLISALHKCVRDSDPEPPSNWLARMLEGGEGPDLPRPSHRRMSTEDIGLADPRAPAPLHGGTAAVHFIGMPEAGSRARGGVVYLALAPRATPFTRPTAPPGRRGGHPKRPVPLHLSDARPVS